MRATRRRFLAAICVAPALPLLSGPVSTPEPAPRPPEPKPRPTHALCVGGPLEGDLVEIKGPWLILPVMKPIVVRGRDQHGRWTQEELELCFGEAQYELDQLDELLIYRFVRETMRKDGQALVETRGVFTTVE